jgi:arsenite methyltransferase
MAVSRRGAYGFDAPMVPALMGVGGLILLVVAVLFGGHDAGSAIIFISGMALLLQSAIYIHTTRSGKFKVWVEILKGLHLRGDEAVLDMGCGRGAVLLTVADLIPRGKAVGLDLWKKVDQSGNDMAATQANAEAEGVADRVELLTGDMRDMPLPNSSFDIVLSSLAIHNIHGPGERDKAVAEAVRVLKTRGRLLIADLPRSAAGYAQELEKLGMKDISVSGLGWRFWYGGPWVAATLVTATKP